MTKPFRFTLEAGSRKIKCVSCGQKTAVRYIDTQTGEALPDHVSRCDRENHCGYHYTPREYFADNGVTAPQPRADEINPEPPRPVDYMPLDYVKVSMAHYDQTNFAQYVIRTFGDEIGRQLLCRYFVGASRAYPGRVVFWQIDAENMVRTGKIMAYSKDCKRSKEVNPAWVHTNLKKFNFRQSFFGEHLIAEHPDKTIGIFESEKTAILASFFFPQMIMLATGGTHGCKWREYETFKVLENRKVIFFPDFGWSNKPKGITCFQQWSETAESISSRIRCDIAVSKILESNLPESERDNGPDLADFLIKPDPQTGIALTEDNGYPWVFDQLNHFSDV